jgi:multicomponent Na+:H+ antiporter subunit C
VTRGKPPLISAGVTADQFADPVPQSLILTAIVIGFGVLAFSLVLAHRVHESAGSDDIDAIGPDSAKASSDKPDRA